MQKVFDLKFRAYQFSKAVILFLTNIEYNWYAYPILKQLLRSATSIGANIIEARSGNSRHVMTNYYSIALRSANETKYWLCLVRDTLDANKCEAMELLKEANELSKILGKAIITLKKSYKS